MISVYDYLKGGVQHLSLQILRVYTFTLHDELRHCITKPINFVDDNYERSSFEKRPKMIVNHKKKDYLPF